MAIKFIIRKTSMYSKTITLDGYKLESEYIPYYDVRGFKTFDECKQRCGENFLSRGSEHRELPNGEGIIRRLADDLIQTITINSLEELLKLSAEHGELIVTAKSISSIYPSIEIYDDYRE
jgi:hypothetical protein